MSARADELARYHVEVIGGCEIQKPFPKKFHFLIQNFLIVFLNMHLSKRFQVAPEVNVRSGNDRIVPDIAVAWRNAHYEDGDLAEAPLLAVEIMSPGQTIADLLHKCDRLIRMDPEQVLCWVIWPEKRRAWMYSAGDLLEASDELTLALPNESGRCAVPLSEMWAALDD